MGHVQTSRLIPAPPAAVFRYITDLENAVDYLGPHMSIEFPSTVPPLKELTEFEAVLSRFKFKVHVLARVDELKPFERFTYRQLTGFFRSWIHTQTLRAHDSQTTLLTDYVDFQLPFGVLGALADDLLIRHDLERVLVDRLMKIEDHFISHQALQE